METDALDETDSKHARAQCTWSSYLIGIKNGSFPEHSLEPSHSTHHMLDLFEAWVGHLYTWTRTMTYLDITEDGLPVLGFLATHLGKTRRIIRVSSKLTSCFSLSCCCGTTSSRTSLTVCRSWPEHYCKPLNARSRVHTLVEARRLWAKPREN